MTLRILIHSTHYLDGTGREAESGYIVIHGDRIAEIGPGDCPHSRSDFDQTIDGANRLVMPGLINAHGHAAMSLLRGFADDMPLHAWLNDRIWPAEAKLSPEDIHLGTQLAMLEMIETGTTTFTDMYFSMDTVAEAVLSSGMRAALGRGIVSGEGATLALKEAEALYRAYHGAGGGRISINLAPHAPYTCSAETLKEVMALAEKLDVPLQIHVSETRKEVQDSLSEHGVSPIVYLHQIGLFSHPVTAAHVVHADDNDLDILAERGVRVSHNPGSNLKLGSGIAPLLAMRERGIIVGLGTDGAASNNKLDLFEEMRLAALLHKGVLENATAIDANAALSMATSQGAKALFLDERVHPDLGTLRVDAPADLILIDLTSPRYFPRHRLLAHAVYSSSGCDVTDVFVAGRALYRNREFMTIDQEKVRYEAERVGAKFHTKASFSTPS
ncbi:hypothetical protein AYW79_09455 [Ferroacidibacillus organovorans]|nr:hypothetical protein AYJ22_09515 [Ferroacidibacillus organovorans]OAG93655.1 hypothetical protein AYW79_09455 [Ferroacidibacillus organovorans]